MARLADTLSIAVAKRKELTNVIAKYKKEISIINNEV